MNGHPAKTPWMTVFAIDRSPTVANCGMTDIPFWSWIQICTGPAWCTVEKWHENVKMYKHVLFHIVSHHFSVAYLMFGWPWAGCIQVA